MAVTNTNLRSPASGGYTCNNSVVDFSGTFRVLAEDDIKVVLTDANGDDTTLTLSDDYTVTPTGGTYPADSFTVTTVATYDVGNKITLLRNMDITQPTGYGNQGPYLPKNHETSYDRAILIIQQLQEVVNRCLALSVSDTTSVDSSAYLAACQAAQAAAEAARDAITSVMTINNQGGDTYTLQASDLGAVVRMTSSNANIVTIPTYSAVNFAIGSTIVIRQGGSGRTSLIGDTGVTLNGVSGGGGVMLFQYGDVMLQNVSQDVWEVCGAMGIVA